MLIFALGLALTLQATSPGEEPVDPYPQSNANAGAVPFKGTDMLAAFHGRAGIDRVVDTMVARNVADPRISDIFKNQDLVRLRRTLKEQFCYFLNGGCDYSGRAMRDAHKNMGLQVADMAALIENLQTAMTKEGVPFFAQNRFLAKLAPMKRVVVER
jgi:hemoglobin